MLRCPHRAESSLDDRPGNHPVLLARGRPLPGGAEPKGVEPGGAESRGGASSGATESGGTGDTRAGGAGVFAGASGTGGSAAAGPGGARTKGAGATGTGGSCAGGAGAGEAEVGGTCAGGIGAAGVGAVNPGAGGAGGTVRPRPYFVPLFQQVLGVPPSTTLTPPLLCPPPDQSQPPLLSASPLPAPSPYTEQFRGLTERREPESRPVSHVRTARRVPRSRPPPVPGTHAMALRPSSVPLRVPLPAPPKSSLPEVPDPESDRARAASPTVSRLLATAISDPSFESAAASALVTGLLDFVAACRLDYATALVAESASAYPPSVGGECALSTDFLEDRQEDFECLAAAVPRFASMLLAPKGDPNPLDILTLCSYAEAITGPSSSQWQEAMDAEMASWKSTGTYVDEVPPPGANIVDGMWIFRVKRPPGSPPAFKARYVARGFSQRQGVDFFHTFSPTLNLTTSHSLSAPPSDESVEPSGPYPELVGCLMYLMTCTRPDLAYHLSLLARYVAPGRHRKVHWDAAKRVLHYLCSTSGMGLVLGGRARVVLTGHADASWVDDSATQRSSQGYTFNLGSGSELRWLTYLLTDLGEQPRMPPVLYVNNKAMISFCQEHRLEHRTKHIALRYFLARELQQHGQLRLAYVATRANTANVFTKALPPGDHQRFATVLDLVPTLPHLLTA
ncbi:unnamed protein product [Closterium sp. NIES-54]